MRIEGNLSKWNDDRGFGFITPVQGGEEVFVHISEFPKDAVRPTVGERLFFEVETERNGKRRAKNLWCPQRPNPVRAASGRKQSTFHRKESPNFLGRIVALLILIGLGAYGYEQNSQRKVSTPAITAEPDIREISSPYHCDGRTHCSQMTSCTEATFFLRHCPNTEMDGDRDDVPCEQQWCSSPLAK
jgi:cold shock CspA family protein